MTLPNADPVTRSILTEYLVPGVIACLILLVLYGISLQSYLIFHTLIEFAGIAVAFTIFIIAWNTRKVLTSTFFLIIGISFLFTGSIDLLHALAYDGMGLFPGAGANLPTQLWIAARYFQSITLFIAALFIGRSLTKDRDYDTALIFAVCAAGSGLLVASIAAWRIFPDCYTPGVGLTPFKIISEYVISIILVATAVVINRKRSAFDENVFRYLIAALCFLVLGELAFTSYISVYGFMNLLGHMFRLISVYFFYRAFVVVALTKPYDLVFRELKESRDALEESEKRYAITLDAVSDGIWEWNLPQRKAIFSDNYYLLLGYEPGEIPGTYNDWRTYIHPMDLPLFEMELDRHVKDGTRFVFDVRMKMKNGDWKWISSRGGVIEWDADGTPLRMVGTHHDITDRKQAESALQDSEERFRILLQVIPIPVCIVNSEGTIIYLNDRFTGKFGYTSVDVPTLDAWWPLAYPDPAYRQWVMDAWDKDMKTAVIEGTDIRPREYRLTCRNGEVRVVEISGIILGDQYLVTFLDVTERQQAEEALLEANQKLNILNSITRHDILNQLTGLKGYHEILKMKIQDPELTRYLQKEENAVMAVERQIAFTRYYQDIGMNAAEWHDVEKIIGNTLLQLKPAGLTLDANLNGLEIFADPLVEKVFYNLFENSLRHGEHVTRVTFSYREMPDGLVLVYQDNGAGITAEDAEETLPERIWEKYRPWSLPLPRDPPDNAVLPSARPGNTAPVSGSRW